MTAQFPLVTPGLDSPEVGERTSHCGASRMVLGFEATFAEVPGVSTCLAHSLIGSREQRDDDRAYTTGVERQVMGLPLSRGGGRLTQWSDAGGS